MKRKVYKGDMNGACERRYRCKNINKPECDVTPNGICEEYEDATPSGIYGEHKPNDKKD